MLATMLWEQLGTVIVMIVLGYLIIMGAFMTVRFFWKVGTKQPMEDIPGFTSRDLERRREEKRQ